MWKVLNAFLSNANIWENACFTSNFIRISEQLKNKHNCVLSNAGLSNALNETEICTSIKYLAYWRHGVVGLSRCWCILQNGWSDRVAVWHVGQGAQGTVY